MKKVFVILCLVLSLAGNSYALQNGLYKGTIIHQVETPKQCGDIYPGYVRIKNLEDSYVLYQAIDFWEGKEIVVEEKECKINGNSINCEPVIQEIDLRPYGIEATILNRASRAAGVITEKGFTMNYSAKRNDCLGDTLPCHEAAMIMLGPEGWFPCKIGPWKTEFVLEGE